MKKMQNHVIYVVTRDGGNPNSDGADVLREIYRMQYPEAGDEDIAIVSGPHLNDPATLISTLKAGNDEDMVIVVFPDELVPCRTGPGPDGAQVVIDILETDIREKYGQTSWEALAQSIREGRGEEQQ